MKKNIGLPVKEPEKTCEDPHCPFHGNISLRGKLLSGQVVSAKMHKTVTVAWERKRHVSKYERYEKKISKIKAHNPECLNAKEGDTVSVMETRPISKTKNFVIVSIQ